MLEYLKTFSLKKGRAPTVDEFHGDRYSTKLTHRFSTALADKFELLAPTPDGNNFNMREIKIKVKDYDCGNDNDIPGRPIGDICPEDNDSNMSFVVGLDKIVPSLVSHLVYNDPPSYYVGFILANEEEM